MTFLGWLPEEKDAYPFRLTKDGRIDFGSGFEDADRWGSTNLRGKRIERGEYATVELDGEEYTYRIDKLDDLSSR